MMIKCIKSLVVTAALAATAITAAPMASAQDAPASSLREVLTRIQADSASQREEAQRREREFRRDRDNQAARLARAEQELAALQAEGERLTAQFDTNDVEIRALEEQLKEAQGAFGELFGVARQAAGDTQGLLDTSVVSSQYPGRTGLLAEVAESRKLPTREQLDAIWLSRLDEMAGQSEVATYTTTVGNFDNGAAAEAQMVRLGAFVAFVNDGGNARFVSVDGETVTMLERQPSAQVRAAARRVISASPDELVLGPIDPSRGDLLEVIVDTPTLEERIGFGGIIGYIIIALLIVSGSFGLLRLVQLVMVNMSVAGQARNMGSPGSNPLGKIIEAARAAEGTDEETYQLKIDEAIIKQASGLDFGLNFLKLAAAIAPLMGLLGTVVGMIVTFQAITLFGAGDPKLMAGGISQALITTVLGLVAAIPLLLIHSFCASLSRAVQQTLEEQSTGLIADYVEKQRK